MLNETNLNTVLFSILRVFHDITFHSFLYSQSCERHPTSLGEGEMSKVGQIPHFHILRVNLIKTPRACLRFLSMRETADDQPSWSKTLGLKCQRKEQALESKTLVYVLTPTFYCQDLIKLPGLNESLCLLGNRISSYYSPHESLLRDNMCKLQHIVPALVIYN